jgi:hypothetical protein
MHFPENNKGDVAPTGTFTMRDEANALVAYAFRNGPLENLHAGQYSELLENPEVSRITDAEMKSLMLDACQKLAQMLQLKATDPEAHSRFLQSYNRDFCGNWQR